MSSINMIKRISLFILALSVMAPLMVLAGCGEKQSKEESEAFKNASTVSNQKPPAGTAPKGIQPPPP
jgi:hypothetical protein